MRKEFTIYYTSDTHGHIFPVDYASGQPEASGLLVFLRNVREFFGSTAVKVVGIVLLVLIAALVIWKVTVGRRRYRYGRSVSRRSRGGGYRGRRR